MFVLLLCFSMHWLPFWFFSHLLVEVLNKFPLHPVRSRLYHLPTYPCPFFHWSIHVSVNRYLCSNLLFYPAYPCGLDFFIRLIWITCQSPSFPGLWHWGGGSVHTGHTLRSSEHLTRPTALLWWHEAPFIPQTWSSDWESAFLFLDFYEFSSYSWPLDLICAQSWGWTLLFFRVSGTPSAN